MTSPVVAISSVRRAIARCDPGRLARWWLTEFLALFPGRIADWLVDRGLRSLVLLAGRDAVALELLAGSRRLLASASIDRAACSPDTIDAFLRAHGLQRKHVSVGVRLPADRVYARKLVLPIETERSLDAIVVQDLTGKTPFQLQDIFHCHTARRTAGKITVWQWVVRRTFVSEVADALGLEADELDFVEAKRSDDGPQPLLPLRQPATQGDRLLRNLALFLAVTASILAAVAGGLEYSRQQLILDTLAAEISATRVKAQRVRTELDKLQHEQSTVSRVRSEKATTPGLLEILEETTRLLPSHTWLTELRLADAPGGGEQQLVITGFSAAAASLVGLIDRSPLFNQASLTAPIAMDRAEEKERFAIQALVRKRNQLRNASR